MSVAPRSPLSAAAEPALAPAAPGAPVVVMSSPLIPVVAHARVTAWPPSQQINVSAYVPLATVLGSRFPTDAHFAAYSRPDQPARLKNEVLPLLEDGQGVPMVLMVFDVDCEEAHREKKPAPDSWFEEEKKKIAQLVLAYPGVFVARSKGGYRIVYVLAQPRTVRNDEDRATWALYYRRCCAYLARTFGIVADPKCADWTRLYRAPHATRDEGGAPEDRDTIGDVSNVGAWTYQPTAEALDADISVASVLAKDSVAWRQHVLGPLVRAKGEPEGKPRPRSTCRRSRSVMETAVPSSAVLSVPGAAILPASTWLAKQPPAIEGGGGDTVTYKVTLGLVKGFELPLDVALDLLLREYNPRCIPPWSQGALQHKVNCAARAALAGGYLLPPAKPEIEITTTEHEVVDQAEGALALHGTLFQRGGALVHVVRDTKNAATSGQILRSREAPHIVPATLARIREELTRVAALKSRRDGELQLAHPPKWLVEELAARGHWPGVPKLQAVVETPILRPYNGQG